MENVVEGFIAFLPGYVEQFLVSIISASLEVNKSSLLSAAVDGIGIPYREV